MAYSINLKKYYSLLSESDKSEKIYYNSLDLIRKIKKETNNNFVELINPEENLIFFKKLLNFPSLIDITAVDTLLHQNNFTTNRFNLYYNIINYQSQIRFQIRINLNKPIASSVEYLYKNANWLERETWDMYGIFFHTHTDLRRILTDYGFEGFPLRKDFPLVGFYEMRYDNEKKTVVYEPLELVQMFRNFDKQNPWFNDFFVKNDERS